ncbi:MAG TPA: hypothetical protein VEX88_09700 [Glaciibacter sp.]|nr:hypothetical protein [Glaciibacter sp.]
MSTSILFVIFFILLPHLFVSHGFPDDRRNGYCDRVRDGEFNDDNRVPPHDAAQTIAERGRPQDPLLVLMASALLGPAAWEPVAHRLTDRGWDVTVAPHASEPAPRTAADALAAYLGAVPSWRPVLLVPHSNAGNFVPALIAERNVVGVVFVDAVIPVDAGRQQLGTPEQLAALEPLVDEPGTLPPWSSWFDPADVDSLFPDPATRSRIEAAQPRLPLSYLRDGIEVRAGWTSTPAGYLAFGDTYAPERERARAQGWPVSTVVGGHLHMVVDPGRVAAEIVALAQL